MGAVQVTGNPLPLLAVKMTVPELVMSVPAGGFWVYTIWLAGVQAFVARNWLSTSGMMPMFKFVPAQAMTLVGQAVMIVGAPPFTVTLK